MTMTLTDAIAAGVAQVGSHGEFFPIHLSPPEGNPIVAAGELMVGDRMVGYFERSVSMWSDHPAQENRHAAASRFMRRYVGGLVVATLVPLAHGAAFDLSIPHVRFVLRGELALGTVIDLDGGAGWVDREHPDPWVLPGAVPVTATELRERAFATLFSGHLAPMIDHVAKVASLSPRVLWTHVAEQVDGTYWDAVEHADVDVRRSIEDNRENLLFNDTIPGVEGPNPLVGLLRWETHDDPLITRPVSVRDACCLGCLLPGRAKDVASHYQLDRTVAGSYCRNCNRISSALRLQMWRGFKLAQS